MTKIAIIGATGRVGTRVRALAREHGCEVVAQIDRKAGEINPGTAPEVFVDFSTPQATRKWLAVAQAQRVAMLIGTTGLSREDHAAIDAAAREIPVMQAPNMSLGVAVLFDLARRAAAALEGCDVEIVESHHRGKKDAPSGTALGLAAAIGRKDPPIPIHSLRMGDEVGRHTAHIALAGERLELTHVATDRDTFARGALRAARWLAQQKPGRYTIKDLFWVGNDPGRAARASDEQ